MNISNGEVTNLIHRTDLESTNDQTIVIASVSKINGPTFHYHFDSRNIERSLFQILILLYVGEVKLHLPMSFVDRFASWFDLTEEEGNEQIILNNLSGRELRELLGKRVIGGESSLFRFMDLHGDQILKSAHIISQFSPEKECWRTPPYLQNWPDFALGRIGPIEHEFTAGHSDGNTEFLGGIPAALSFLIYDYEGDDTFFGFEPEKVRERVTNI